MTNEMCSAGAFSHSVHCQAVFGQHSEMEDEFLWELITIPGTGQGTVCISVRKNAVVVCYVVLLLPRSLKWMSGPEHELFTLLIEFAGSLRPNCAVHSVSVCRIGNDACSSPCPLGQISDVCCHVSEAFPAQHMHGRLHEHQIRAYPKQRYSLGEAAVGF